MTDTLLAEAQAEIERLKVMAQPVYTSTGLTRRAELLFSGLILLGLLVFIWDRLTPAPVPVNQWVAAPVAKVIAHVPTVSIQPKMLRVYAPVAKKKLNLPPALQQDDNEYVISATTLKPDYHPQTTTTLVNKETGETTTVTRRDPYPWIAFQNSGEARIDYGIKDTGARVGRLTVREDFVQVKGINLGVTATLDSDRAAFAGIGAGYKW
jgi:hypothetical protein